MAPFADMSEVPNSLKGIDPPITLEQANEIAQVADAIERRLKQHPPKKKTNPWAVAISQFKQITHRVSDDGTRWVRRERHSEMTIEFESHDLLLREAQYSRTQCMMCSKPPVVAVHWADGRGRAWFCLPHFREWAQEEREIVRAWFLKSGEVPKKMGQGDDVLVKKLQDKLKPSEIIKRIQKLVAIEEVDMQGKMFYVEAPENLEGAPDYKAVFLAGGITGCPDWQQTMVELLRNTSVTLLNPRRADFPIGDPGAAKEQITWEHNYLRKAGAILFWFPCETICPIVLYELGAWSVTNKPIFVGVHPQYSRRQDVEIQTELVRPKVKIVYSLKELSQQVVDFVAEGA